MRLLEILSNNREAGVTVAITLGMIDAKAQLGKVSKTNIALALKMAKDCIDSCLEGNAASEMRFQLVINNETKKLLEEFGFDVNEDKRNDRGIHYEDTVVSWKRRTEAWLHRLAKKEKVQLPKRKGERKPNQINKEG